MMTVEIFEEICQIFNGFAVQQDKIFGIDYLEEDDMVVISGIEYSWIEDMSLLLKNVSKPIISNIIPDEDGKALWIIEINEDFLGERAPEINDDCMKVGN